MTDSGTTSPDQVSLGELTLEPPRAVGTVTPEQAATTIKVDEKTAQQILRNSQRAVRSAKETILDVIGRPLEDQLKLEAINGYSTADTDETLGLLGQFYDKTDPGRAGSHETPL